MFNWTCWKWTNFFYEDEANIETFCTWNLRFTNKMWFFNIVHSIKQKSLQSPSWRSTEKYEYARLIIWKWIKYHFRTNGTKLRKCEWDDCAEFCWTFIRMKKQLKTKTSVTLIPPNSAERRPGRKKDSWVFLTSRYSRSMTIWPIVIR